jgi:UPF0716 protein FxsA
MQRHARLAAAAPQILGHCKAQANPHGLLYPAARLKGGAMARLLLGLALIALPFVELALLIKTGQTIGFWPTLGLLVGAAVVGGAIMSRQGLTVARRTQEAVALGRPPVGPVLDGALMLLAGALLITPGFVTDAIALALLIPPIRRKVARATVRRLVERAQMQVRVHKSGSGAEGGRAGKADGPIIEGEFVRLGENSQPSDPGEDGDRTQSRSR